MKIKLFLLICMLFITSACNKEEPDGVILSFLNEIEVYEDVMFHDLITDSNVEIINENFKIIPDSLGEKKYKLNYRYENKKYTREFSVKVVDTVKPFIYSGASRAIYLNNEHDFCEELILGDNHDKSPRCEIIGEYDNTKIGNYNIQIKVTDQSSNEFVRNLTVKVIERPKTTTKPTPQERLQFNTVVEKHQATNASFGIDVSKWQGEVDFNEVKNAGASFVMIRLGYQKGSNKELEMDSYYKQNITNAKNAGLKVGVYLYTDAESVKDAKKHAKWVIEQLNGESLDLSIVFDWEDFSNFRKYRLSLHELNEMANVFIKTVNDAGYKGMLYSSKTYLENFWENKYNHPVWLAHYVMDTDYEGEYLMWQLSNIGRIPGIAGDVDINIMYE